MHSVLPHDADAGALSAALAAAAEGLIVLAPVFAPVHHPALGRDVSASIEELTPRELDVLQLLAEGLPNKAIARRLGISEHTVKFHLDAVLGKLDAHSRTEAVTRAARLGLIIL
jgi:DNA-binding NarL/FixJ family response regulator